MSAPDYEIVSHTYSTGEWRGVRFLEEQRGGSFVGVGRTTDYSVAAWFRGIGWTVTPDPYGAVDALPRVEEGEGAREALPSGFPARDVLESYGFTTVESLEGMTAQRLESLKGIGPARARAILKALHG